MVLRIILLSEISQNYTVYTFTSIKFIENANFHKR
jgi:hypothetical protein